MSNKTLGLILGIILALCLLVGIAGGTYAYFRDTETSTGNELTAGTLDLVSIVSGSYSGDSSDYTVTAGGNGINGNVVFDCILPGQTGTIKWVLTNNGNIPGKLTISSSLVFDEGEVTEPEDKTGVNDHNGDGTGDLDIFLKVTLQRGAGATQAAAESNFTYILGSNVNPVAISGLETVLDSQNLTMDANGGTNDTVVYLLTWSLPNDNNINAVQGDTAEIDITFILEQIID